MSTLSHTVRKMITLWSHMAMLVPENGGTVKKGAGTRGWEGNRSDPAHRWCVDRMPRNTASRHPEQLGVLVRLSLSCR